MDEVLRAGAGGCGLYDQDFAARAIDQAARLREAAYQQSLDDAGLDWANLAEEIEASARRDRREFPSLAARVNPHARQAVTRALQSRHEAPLADLAHLDYTIDQILDDWWPAAAGG